MGSIMVAFTFERVNKHDTHMICMFLSKNGERCTENMKVVCRNFLLELFRREVDIDFTSRGFLPKPEKLFSASAPEP